MRKSLSLNSICRDSVSRVSSEYPLVCGFGSSSSDSGGRPDSSPPVPWNSGICCSRLARSLFSTTAGAGGSIFTGSRLARAMASVLRTVSRSSRMARVCCHSLACWLPRRNRSGSISTYLPMRSITANHDRPVASVTEVRNSTSRNRLPPSPPNSFSSDLPTSVPRMPPAPAEKCSAGTPRRCSRPVAEIRKPTMPIRRSAGPRSASPSPSVSMPNSAIQATAPRINGSRKAT